MSPSAGARSAEDRALSGRQTRDQAAEREGTEGPQEEKNSYERWPLREP